MASYFTLGSSRPTLAGMAKPVDSQCRAFQHALDVLARPWNALVLNVLQGGPLRFSEIRVRAQGPGDKVLSGRLKELEAHGLVLRMVGAGPPVRVSYQLTESGRAFGEVAQAIERWGRGLNPAPAGSRGKQRKRA
ncbi:MAG TPA: helix-turn-helix domain-containing protein [Candidatus Eisenbacteria bacterium]